MVEMVGLNRNEQLGKESPGTGEVLGRGRVRRAEETQEDTMNSIKVAWILRKTSMHFGPLIGTSASHLF